MAISYDTLELKISADVSNASRGIKSLTNNLSRLQETVKSNDFALIDKLQKHLQNIAKIDFSNVSKGLRDVVSAFQQVNREQSKFKPKPFDNTKAINLMTAGGTGNFNLEPPLPNIQLPEPRLPELAKSEAFSALNGTMKELKVNAEQVKVAMDNTKKAVKESGKEATKSAGHFQKLIGAFKRVLFYRVVRRTLQLIVQAMKEGIQNVALFDEDFNKSMSNIVSSFEYLKNSLGVVLATLIQLIEPFLIMLIDGVSEFANKLAEVFSAMNGKNTFTKATKGAKDYAESLKKVKDTTLGIDELNVIKPQEQQGGNFETAEVEKTAMNEAFGQFGETLKGILNEVFGFVKEIWTTIGSLLQKVLPSILALLEPIRDILKVVEEIVIWVVNIASDILGQILPPILDMIGKFLSFVASFIGYAKPFIQMIATTIGFIFELLKPSLDVICSLTGKLFEFVGHIYDLFKPVAELLNAIYTILFDNFIQKAKGFFEKIGDFLFGSDESRAVKNIGAIITPAFASGGFPEDGLFYANHNELVGQFSSGQTAVANNEQIIEGIKQGVYEAMVMAGGNANENGTQVVVYLDSREIAKRVEERQMARKDNGLSGGYKYGG